VPHLYFWKSANRAIEDMAYARGIARLRAFYLALVPEPSLAATRVAGLDGFALATTDLPAPSTPQRARTSPPRSPDATLRSSCRGGL
jgi:hypothetical protein